MPLRQFYLIFLLIFCLAAGPARSERLGVAIVHQGTIAMHGSAYQHDLARQALEKFYGDKISVTTVENVQPNADGERVISSLARKGNSIIFITSPGLEKMVAELAKKYADVYFEIADGSTEGDNISTFNGRFYEARYIVGQIAARVTETGIIGYVAADMNATTMRDLNAYTLGAQTVKPNITVVMATSGETPAPEKEAHAARDVIAQGADVLAFQTETPAPAQVAEQNGVKVFGNAADMSSFAPQTQITSVIHDWSGYYIKRVGAALEGKWTATYL
ncbi:MAG: BMP family ABC transporter substrate-binding protein, partial [Pseudomonadota bacterium]